MKLEINIKALPGDKVDVSNYRRRDHWERGTVLDTEIIVNKDRYCSNRYRILLDRTSKGRSRLYPNGGAPLFIVVGDNKISRI